MITDKNKTLGIIGGGFGGLALGIRMQNSGYDVTILEKNPDVGGHGSQIKDKGYTFDMGPSLITAKNLIDDLFKLAGKKVEDYLEFHLLDPFYRIYFHDQSYIDYCDDGEKMKAQMAVYSQGDADNYDKFMEYSKKLYEAVIEDGLGKKPFTYNELVEFLPEALKLNAFFPVHNKVAHYFKDFRHRFLYSFHPLFIGGNPFTAPSVYLMIPYLEKAHGVWYTKGGMFSLVKAMEKLFTESGGKVITNSEVKKIKVENGRAEGVLTAERFYQFDKVVSNAHFAHTSLDLIDESARGKWTDRKVKRLSYSMSSFIIYLGVKKKYPKFKHHTLVLSERYRDLVNDIFKRKVLADDFSLYIHVPSITDPTMAPEGSDSIYILTPVPNLKAEVDWDEIKEEYAEKILDFLQNEFGLEDLKENIEVMHLFTPNDFKSQRNNYLGSAWGVEPKLSQTAMFRPKNKSEDVFGLYLVGAGTHPGAGLPGVLLSAEATQLAILNDTAEESLNNSAVA